MMLSMFNYVDRIVTQVGRVSSRAVATVAVRRCSSRAEVTGARRCALRRSRRALGARARARVDGIARPHPDLGC